MTGPRLVIVGAAGQLGSELMRIGADWKPIALTRAHLDLADPSNISDVLTALEPTAIINAAAYTNVDKAESEPELAFALNRDAPAAMAQAAARLNAAFVHVSTDYVFDGAKAGPYVEDDTRAPLNIYGLSKAEGEDAVFGVNARATVVRTSWVFSHLRTNFVKTMLRLGGTRDELDVVADQVGRPTAAVDLARACLALAQLQIQDNVSGLFHYAGADDASRADFAEAIFASSSLRGQAPVRVKRVATMHYPAPAQRPLNSRLDTRKIEAFGIAPRPWRHALEDCLDDLLGPRMET